MSGEARTRRRRTSSDDRQSEIKRAAMQCFIRSGVAGATTEEIRSASGASVGSIYHHFDSKADIAAQLYLEVLEAMHGHLLAGLRTSDVVAAGIRESVASYMRWVRDDRDAAAYFMHCREPEVVELSDQAAREQNARFFGQIMEWLVATKDPGALRELTPQVFFGLWMGPLEMYAQLWLDGSRDPAAMDKAVPELQDGIVAAVCVP